MRKTQPLKRGVRRAKAAIERTFPPPVGGWNANESLASMKPTEAVELVNFFPRPTYVETRPGSECAHLIKGQTIRTMATWKGLDGDEHLVYFTDEGAYVAQFGLYFVTTDNGLAKWETRTNGWHQWIQFGDGTNNWLMAFNGVDKPFFYDGSASVEVDGVSTPAITGLTTTDLISAAVFKERILLIRKDKLGFDYLPAGAAGGAASFFDLSSVADLGGYLMAIAVWTRDAGNGPDDYAVFITSQGEALVYAGTDPGNANAWSLVGTFRIGKPIGRRCVLKYGADPLILTIGGVFPLSSLLQAGDERERFAVSYKIQSAFSSASAQTSDLNGWTMVSYPEQDMLVVNVPRSENGARDQFVMNTITKAWCKFTGWSGHDFVTYQGGLYYCKGSAIYRAWKRSTDEYTSLDGYTIDNLPVGRPITYTARQAFQDWGSPSVKSPLMFMPLMDVKFAHDYVVGVDTDFTTTEFLDMAAEETETVGRWSLGHWGIARWGRSQPIQKRWQGAASWPGRWLSGKIRMISRPRGTIDEVVFESDDPIGKWLGSVMRFTIGDAV